jgi:hypothetical protein
LLITWTPEECRRWLTHLTLKNTSWRDEFSKASQFTLNNHSFNLLLPGQVAKLFPHQKINIVRSFSQILNHKFLRGIVRKDIKKNKKNNNIVYPTELGQIKSLWGIIYNLSSICFKKQKQILINFYFLFLFLFYF